MDGDRMSASFIMDTGSCAAKFGQSGNPDGSISIVPTVVGRPRLQGDYMISVSGQRRQMVPQVGHVALQRRAVLKLSSPLENGTVKSWPDLELLWQSTFPIESQGHPVLMTKVSNSVQDNVKMAQVAFETFNAPSLFIADQAVLALYASGRTTGVVVDLGHSAGNVVPIFDGYALPHARTRLPISGSHLTEHLTRILAQHGTSLSANSTDRDVAREVKDKLCYVSLDYENEVSKAKDGSLEEKTYELPDGKSISVGEASFVCAEALFTPSLLLGTEAHGVHTNIVNAVQKSDVDLRRDLRTNVVLAGGTTNLPGFSDRILKEISAVSDDEWLLASPFRDGGLAAWHGAAILASMSGFDRMCLDRKDYDERGPEAVRSKFNLAS